MNSQSKHSYKVKIYWAATHNNNEGHYFSGYLFLFMIVNQLSQPLITVHDFLCHQVLNY